MDINKLLNEAVRSAESNPIIAAVLAVVLLYMIIKHPKVLFGFIAIVLFVGAVMKGIARIFKDAAF
jgi:hypothetical protein